MRRTKAEAEQTRSDILKAALVLFDEQGYSQTTLSKVARQAQVTRGAIYWHFADKEEILATLAQVQFAELNSQINASIAAPDTWQNLTDNFIAYFRSLLANPDRLRFCRVFNQHGRVPALEKLYRDYSELWQAQCREAVVRSKESGELRQEADPEYLYFYLIMMFSGLVDLCLVQSSMPNFSEYCERTIRHCMAQLKAL